LFEAGSNSGGLVYAQIIRRADRDQLRAEIRQLLGVDHEAAKPAAGRALIVGPPGTLSGGVTCRS
jgi:hypothetical protein